MNFVHNLFIILIAIYNTTNVNLNECGMQVTKNLVLI